MSRRIFSTVAGCALLASAIAAPPLLAQSIFDIGARIGPQFHQYTIGSPTNTTISEFAVPLFALVPITPSLSLDVGTSYARSRVEQTTNTNTVTSSISGLTDTQIRANYVLGSDFVVLTAGVNLPTGRANVTASQQLAGSLIGSDFLAFPISNMGTGFGGTGGVAVARPLGDWNLGFGLSLRRSAQYDPFDAAGGPALHYQPGNEYRARFGVDRAAGTGRVALGLTYSTFGNDNLAGSLYNTGNRWLTQGSYNNTLGAGQLAVTGWNQFRTRGTLSDSSLLGHENITNGSVAYGVTVGTLLIEPNVEGRMWMQEGVANSFLATPGLRATTSIAGFTMLPSVGYSLGRLAAEDANGVRTTASLTGGHATLAIRLR
jgi:hypothetical protein